MFVDLVRKREIELIFRCGVILRVVPIAVPPVDVTHASVNESEGNAGMRCECLSVAQEIEISIERKNTERYRTGAVFSKWRECRIIVRADIAVLHCCHGVTHTHTAGAEAQTGEGA